MELKDELIAKKMSHAFMGFSIYEGNLIPVYDLNACLEAFATDGLDENEATELIQGEKWVERFGSIKPIFWVGMPNVERQVVH